MEETLENIAKGKATVKDPYDLLKERGIPQTLSDEEIGGRPQGYTWHHSEVPGQMELVPTGLHNVYNHNGGRTINHWAYREGGR